MRKMSEEIKKATWRDLDDSDPKKERMLLCEAIATLEKQKKDMLKSLYETNMWITVLKEKRNKGA